MDVILELRARARRLKKRIVLPESQDPRVIQAAAALASEGLCQVVLVEVPGRGTVPPGVECARPARDPRIGQFAAECPQRRKHRGVHGEDMSIHLFAPLRSRPTSSRPRSREFPDDARRAREKVAPFGIER